MAETKIGKKAGRGWKWLLLAVLVIAGAAFLYFWPTIHGLTQAGTAYGARVGCACRHIGGRTLEDCKKDFEDGMEMVSLSEDADAKQVEASVPLLARHVAEYREGYGCVMLTEEEMDAG